MNITSWIRDSEINVPLPSNEDIWVIHDYTFDKDMELTQIAIISSEGDYQGGLVFDNCNTGFLVIVSYLPILHILNVKN
jgi:hypothetical protein